MKASSPSSSSVLLSRKNYVTRQEAIDTLLYNDDDHHEDDEDHAAMFHDLKLMSGIDHQVVLACRSWLAARSLVFRTLLYGRFRERSQSTIVINGYTGVVLQTLVEFIYTEDAKLFQLNPLLLQVAKKNKKQNEGTNVTNLTRASSDADAGDDFVTEDRRNNHNNNKNRMYHLNIESNEELVETVVAVADAANYFAIPELSTKAEEYTQTLIQLEPSLACMFVTACESYYPTGSNNSDGDSDSDSDDGGKGVEEGEEDHVDDITRRRRRRRRTTTTASGNDSATLHRIKNIPMHVIRSNPKLFLLGQNNGGQGGRQENSLGSMTRNQLECIFRDDQLNCSEYDLFLILQSWYQQGQQTHHQDNNNNGGNFRVHGGGDYRSSSSSINNNNNAAAATTTTNMNTNNRRWKDAQYLSKYIQLERVDPVKLSTVISNCGFVTMEQLTDAYKAQAITASKHHHVRYDGHTRTQPVWKSSGCSKYVCTTNGWSVEMLKQHSSSSKPFLHVGSIYQWSIRVEKDCQDTWLGVATTTTTTTARARASAEIGTNNSSHENNNNDDEDGVENWLGGQPYGYVYGSSGWCWHDDDCAKRGLPTFTEGSTVTFLLDLSLATTRHDENSRNGTLSAAVDVHSNNNLGNALTTRPPPPPTFTLLFDNMITQQQQYYYATTVNEYTENASLSSSLSSSLSLLSFVPAVFLRSPGEVTFLGFEDPTPPTTTAGARTSTSNV